MSLEATNKKVVGDWIKAFSAGDQKGTLALMADSCTWWIAGTMPISKTYSKAEFGQLLAGVSDAMKGPIVMTPKAMTAEGDRVAVEAESLAHKRDGRTYNNFYHLLFTVKDGKIASAKEYLDTMHAQKILCE